MIGHVKFFNKARGFGFILPDGKSYRDKADVFFHESKIESRVPISIEDGAEVEYELIPHIREQKAISVRLTGRAYAPVRELARKGAAYGSD